LASPFWDQEMYMADTKAKSSSVHFNPGSPKQMSWMVFTRLKLKPRIKRGTSTAKEVLDSIPKAPPLIQKVREYRKIQKEHSTYVVSLLKLKWDDDRVRTNFTLHVTATGRLSSKEPNLQNQPSANAVSNLRKAFIAPPGYVLAEIDYSGAELRWLAYLSEDQILTDIFKSGKNLHDETATKLYGADFTKQQKMRAKAVNFGIAYGREAKSLADEFEITMAEAQLMVNGWLNAYPGAKAYLQRMEQEVIQGETFYTKFGRQRRFGLISNESLHNLQNEAKNFAIQSSSSDLLLMCAMEVEDQLAEWGVQIVNLVHDSFVMYIPDDFELIKKVQNYCATVMAEMPIELFNCPIPFTTDFELGLNWGEIADLEIKGGKFLDHGEFKDFDVWLKQMQQRASEEQKTGDYS
jgi:DNA polymerase-1